jgi:hypothetical protein
MLTPEQIERQFDNTFQSQENPARISESPEWQAPEPLITSVQQAPYPLDALPNTIRAAVVEVQAFTKAPVALVASSALGALSVAIQAYSDVRRAEKLAGPVSLFTLTIPTPRRSCSWLRDLLSSAKRQFFTPESPQTGHFRLLIQRERKMSKEKFRIGLIFTPDSLLSVGVLNGNDPQAYKFIGRIQPLIDEFMDRVKDQSRSESHKLDRIVSSLEEIKS